MQQSTSKLDSDINGQEELEVNALEGVAVVVKQSHHNDVDTSDVIKRTVYRPWYFDDNDDDDEIRISKDEGVYGSNMGNGSCEDDSVDSLFMEKHREHLDQLVKLQLSNNCDQPAKAPLVTSAGLWGFVPPRQPVRTEHPASFFSSVKQPGVVKPSELFKGDVVPNESASIEVVENNNDSNSSNSCDKATDGEVFPALFHWVHGGNKVSLTGSFTDWSVSSAIPMIKTAGRHFSCIVYLPRGLHRYKFIVNDEIWQYCPRQLQEHDRKGNINNVLDMRNFDSHSLNKLFAYQQVYGTFPYPAEPWNHTIPDVNDMTADCPTATRILLNCIMGGTHELQDLSGYSAILNHTIIKHCRQINKEGYEAKYLSDDLSVASIYLPCEHANTGSPDPRLTGIHFYCKTLEEKQDKSYRDRLPALFEIEDSAEYYNSEDEESMELIYTINNSTECQKRIPYTRFLGQWTEDSTESDDDDGDDNNDLGEEHRAKRFVPNDYDSG